MLIGLIGGAPAHGGEHVEVTQCQAELRELFLAGRVSRNLHSRRMRPVIGSPVTSRSGKCSRTSSTISSNASVWGVTSTRESYQEVS